MRVESIKTARRARRRKRVRKKISGTPPMPRLAVYRSNRNISAQIIDDLSGRTLCGLSTLTQGLRSELAYAGNVTAAATLGKALAEEAKGLGIERVCFDRGGRAYHGRVKAFAEAAREAGLKF